MQLADKLNKRGEICKFKNDEMCVLNVRMLYFPLHQVTAHLCVLPILNILLFQPHLTEPYLKNLKSVKLLRIWQKKRKKKKKIQHVKERKRKYNLLSNQTHVMKTCYSLCQTG